MKRIAILLLFISILVSCQNSKNREYLDKINDLISKFENNTQVFKVSSKERKTIIAKNGLKILFDANKLMTEDSSALADSVSVEIIECLNQADFIKANIKTVSGGKLLVSGGAFNISVTSNGKKLRLKENDSLTVYLPKYSKEEMNLFYGKKDSMGSIQWETTPEINNLGKTMIQVPPRIHLLLGRIIRGDSTKEQNLNKDYYDPIKITSLNWINCDRFYDIKEKTNLNFSFNTQEQKLAIRIYLIFKDINCVTANDYIISKKEIINNGFKDMPLYSNVRIVVVSLIEDKIVGFYKDTKINKNETHKIKLSEITEKELNDIINLK